MKGQREFVQEESRTALMSTGVILATIFTQNQDHELGKCLLVGLKSTCEREGESLELAITSSRKLLSF